MPCLSQQLAARAKPACRIVARRACDPAPVPAMPDGIARVGMHGNAVLAARDTVLWQEAEEIFKRRGRK